MKQTELTIFSLLGLVIVPIQFASACSVCFGDPSSPLTKGIGLGIWTLMGFIGAVLGMLAVFFFNVRGRIRKFSSIN